MNSCQFLRDDICLIRQDEPGKQNKCPMTDVTRSSPLLTCCYYKDWYADKQRRCTEIATTPYNEIGICLKNNKACVCSMCVSCLPNCQFYKENNLCTFTGLACTATIASRPVDNCGLYRQWYQTKECPYIAPNATSGIAVCIKHANKNALCADMSSGEGCGQVDSKPTHGIKYDTEKLRYDLIPTEVLEALAKRYTHGANEYGVNNWQSLDGLTERYYAALLRHLMAWRAGEKMDPDPRITMKGGLSHLSAVLWNAAAILWKEEQDERSK